MPTVWKIRDRAIGGLTEVGFVPGSSLLMVASHQGRGIFDLASGQPVARDRQETGSWLDALRPAVLGIGPAAGQWIGVAGLAGGQLPVTTADGWHAGPTAHGVALYGPAGETVAIPEPEEIRACGFSPDGQAFIVATPRAWLSSGEPPEPASYRTSLTSISVSGRRVSCVRASGRSPAGPSPFCARG